MAVAKRFRGKKSEPKLGEQVKSLQQAYYDNVSVDSLKGLRCFSIFDKNRGMFSPEDLQDCIIRLHKYCLTHLLDSYRVHLNRMKGVRVLNQLVSRTYYDDLKISQIVRIIWCAISIVHHFHIRLKVGRSFTVWTRKRQADYANFTFDRVMQLLLPDLFSTIIHSIVTFFEEARLWDTELLCSDVIKRVLKYCDEYDKCFNVLLGLTRRYLLSSEVERVTHVLDLAEGAAQPANGRKIVRVIYDILEDHQWLSLDLDLMNRFLAIFRRSIMPNDHLDFSHFKKGMEICIRRILVNVSNTDLLQMIEIMLEWTLSEGANDEALLEFGNVLEFASILHTAGLYRYTLTDTIFPKILELVASDNLLSSLLGHRILQNLMDRHNNKTHLDIARIFFQDVHFNIAIGEYYTEDKALLRKYREIIHKSILYSVMKHGMHRIHMESTYTTLAIFVVEVPCGYTAAAMVCLSMAIQEVTIEDDFIELECSNRIHAIVMALMSLICWVHNAEIFYEYLNTILQRRAELAPHLNPPLQTVYDYARHHILWSKPELFFEDWEVRYGLWKCFRAQKNGLLDDLITNSKIIAPEVTQPLKEGSAEKKLEAHEGKRCEAESVKTETLAENQDLHLSAPPSAHDVGNIRD